MAFDTKKFLARFVEEAREHVKTINDCLLQLEKDPADTDTLATVFRSAHTIKGSSKMMKLSVISGVAHKLEDALDALRQGAIDHTQGLSDILFKGVDAISRMIETVSAEGEILEDHEAICKELEMAATGRIDKVGPNNKSDKNPEEKTQHEVTSEEEPPHKKDEMAKDESAKDVIADTGKKVESEERKPKAQGSVRISEHKLDDLIKLMGEIVSTYSRMKRRIYDVNEIARLSKQNMEFISDLEEEIMHGPDDMDKMLGRASSLYNDLKKFVVDIREDAFVFEFLTGELQERSLEMRMMPLSTIFDGFHRTVRDISRGLEKDVDFVVEGGDTELDKKIIEKIGDSFIHMIRNSIDHGIEKIEERKKAGKPEKGTIKLSARYEGGSVLIELSDDGAGIQVERIKQKALKKKMFDKDALDNIPESEIINLIFHPGFSTSEMITDMSGRGVGMDVVKKNICDDLKGSVQVITKEGIGTWFYIRLPLTMAIMHVLVVSVSKMVFAIPSHFVKEIIRVKENDIIDVVDKRAIKLREQIIPVVSLNDVLGLTPIQKKDEKGNLVLIVTEGNEYLGLIVDEVLQEEDRTIKPLPDHMKDIEWISGVTVSGKNELDNVLYIPRIMEDAKDVKVGEYIKSREETDKNLINILVVDDSASTREIEKNILESYGYTVSLAGDGQEAFENAMENKYDLVVTDIEMPLLDGFSLTKKLKNEEEYQDTPVILVSSRDKEEDKKRGMQVGADAYIVKGEFDQTNLLDAIQSLVG